MQLEAIKTIFLSLMIITFVFTTFKSNFLNYRNQYLVKIPYFSNEYLFNDMKVNVKNPNYYYYLYSDDDLKSYNDNCYEKMFYKDNFDPLKKEVLITDEAIPQDLFDKGIVDKKTRKIDLNKLFTNKEASEFVYLHTKRKCVFRVY